MKIVDPGSSDGAAGGRKTVVVTGATGYVASNRARARLTLKGKDA